MKLISDKEYPFYRKQVPHFLELNNYSEYVAAKDCIDYFKSKYVYLELYGPNWWATLHVSHKSDFDILKIKYPKLFP